MYADFNYYQTEYMGDVIESADNFTRYSQKAAKQIDILTTKKLRFAFPFDEQGANAVKDCECELADFLYKIDQYNKAAMESMGTIVQADGTVRGKVMTSVTSGSESRGYSASASMDTELAEAAKDKKVADTKIYGIISDNLSLESDANGVNLLYRGIPYPRSTKVVNPPPTYPKDEQTEPNPQLPDNSDNESGEISENNPPENSETDSGEDDGIGYVDSIIIYNQYTHSLMQTQSYFGTRFDNVRVELTQGANQKASGMESASVCVAKIPNANLPKPYKSPQVWLELTTEEMLESFTLNKGQDFFVVVKKADLGIDVDLPVGEIQSDNYEGYDGGFFEYAKTKYGYVFNIDTVDVYTLIPRFEIGGR